MATKNDYVTATTEDELVACVRVTGWLYGAAGLGEDTAVDWLCEWLEQQPTHADDDEILLGLGMAAYEEGRQAGLWG